MPNHPNRARPNGASSPAPADIKATRQAAGLSQTAAGALAHTTCRVWQQWEAGDRRMHPAFWDLFQRRVAERPA
ncbi:MAG: XRE family transcriptional regulator [Pseudomonadota bacterium]|nr:XRE family transcriptional regulator [Pseudomonadota bacterium]